MPNGIAGQAKQWLKKNAKGENRAAEVKACCRALKLNESGVRRRWNELYGNSVVNDTVESRTSDVTGGITINGVRMSSYKPAETIRRRFFSLRRNMAYPISELSKQWIASVETLRKHAKQAKCLRYVEINHEWVPCILHPDTAEKTGDNV